MPSIATCGAWSNAPSSARAWSSAMLTILCSTPDLRTPVRDRHDVRARKRSTCGFRAGRSPGASLREALCRDTASPTSSASSRIAHASGASSPSRRPPGNSSVKRRTAGRNWRTTECARPRSPRAPRHSPWCRWNDRPRRRHRARSPRGFRPGSPRGRAASFARRRCAERRALSKSSQRSSPVHRIVTSSFRGAPHHQLR